MNKNNLSKEARHTVEVLLVEAGTSDCSEANNILPNQILLNLDDNQISDLRPLSSLTNLTSLNLDNNQISDIRPLSSLTKLASLNLDHNQISDIRPLSSLTNLTSLNLDNNQISDISPLSSLTNLVQISLNNNQVSNISPLSSLTNLTTVSLDKNQITDIKPLSSLTKITSLYLTNNPIPAKNCPIQPATICSFSNDGEELYKQAQKQYQQSQFQAALATFQKALAIYQAAGDSKRVGDVFSQMGEVASNSGQYALALDLYQQALTIHQELKDIGGEIATLASLGILYERLGQDDKAIQILEKALNAEPKIKNALQNTTIQRNSNTSIVGSPAATMQCGYFNITHGECSVAISNNLKFSGIATSIFENRPQGWNAVGAMFNSLASVHNKRGNYSKALYFARLALAFYRKGIPEPPARDSKPFYGEANALDTVGVAYSRLSNSKLALLFLEKALERMRELDSKAGEGHVLNHIGELYFNQKQSPKALEFYLQALPLRQQAEDIAGQGETLNNLGSLYFTQGQYAEAEKELLQAADVLEKLRPGLKDDEKIAIFETQTVTYRLLQKALIAQNKFDKALEISDRARARAFVELLAQRFTNSNDAQVTPLTLEQIQRIAKEQNATLVEYSLIYDDFNINGKQQPEESELYIWVIQPTGEITFRRRDLKPLWQQQKTSLDKIVGEARCFENDACRQTLIASRGVGNIPEIRGGLSAIGFNNAPGQSVAAAQGQQQNRQLQQLHQLLIEPIADILPKDPNNRVIFIPQSSLFLAPFPALQDEKGNYLIEKHTILTAPSIQVLDLTHQQRQKLSPSIKDALVVGNPTMPTIVEIGKPPEKLSPLPGAETEAKEIAQLLNTTPLIGNQATESVVVQKMPSARIIHLATHGSFDPERGIGSWIALAPDSPTSLSQTTPSLTRETGGVKNVTSPIAPPLTRGAGGVPNLALNKPTVNQPSANSKNLTPQPPSLAGKGEPNTPLLLGEEPNPRKGVGDGLLKAEEIVDLKLNAELVALSACDTAQGKITGDGVVGLSRAIISAGVPSVLVSLWKVDDNATAFLMQEFYQNWRKSRDKAQAIRQAMLTTKQKYSHPINWAAFTLIGEAE